MQKLLTRAAVVGLLLGGWLGGPVAAQPGPLSAQIQRALRALGLTAGGSPTFGTVTATTVLTGNGTAAAPSFSFASAPTVGFYLVDANTIGAAKNNTIMWTSSTSTFRLQPGLLAIGASAADAQLQYGGASGKLQLLGTTPMFQLGGTTSSFPALKQSGAQIHVKLADDSAYAPVVAGDYFFGASGGTYRVANALIFNSVPTNISACGGGTAPTFVWTNGTAAFEILTGSATPVATCTWTMPAAAHAWVCDITDITTQSANVFVQKMSASSTTSVTMTNYNTAGAATAVVASDHLLVKCLGG